MLLKTVIVEYELHSREFLHQLLAKYCPQVQVIAHAVNREEAISSITYLKPDLVFLDIELRNQTGFEIFQAVGYPDFQVIFTTSPGQPSIKAIQFCGANYLLKPVDSESLQAMINNVAEKKNSIISNLPLKYLYDTLQNHGRPEYLYIPNMIGGEYVAIRDILRIEVQDKDAVFFMCSGISHPSIHSIRDYEILFEELPFFRTDHSHMVNLKEIASIKFQDDLVEMSDGSLIPLLPKRKNELAEIIKKKPGQL